MNLKALVCIMKEKKEAAIVDFREERDKIVARRKVKRVKKGLERANRLNDK